MMMSINVQGRQRVRCHRMRHWAWMLVLCWLAGCSSWQSMEEPELSVVGFQLLKTDNPFSQPYQLTVKVSNPNDRALDVKQLVFDFALDDVVLLRGRSQAIPVIAPLGESTFVVNGAIGLTETFRVLGSVLQGALDNPFRYRMTAKITLRHHWPSTFTVERDGEISPADMMRKVKHP